MKKKNLHELHRKIYNYIYQKALSYEGQATPLLKQYREQFHELSERNFHEITEEFFLNQLSKHQIVYIGDFHTFDQSPRNFERILKHLVKADRPLLMGLEMVKAEDQIFLDSFINKFITEQEFLESISYADSWRFPWNHYKAIFDLAIENQIELIALNSPGDLLQRDLFAAGRIHQIINFNRECNFLILFGEYHIMPNKIPNHVKQLNPKIRQLIVYQNMDEVYWKQDADKRNKSFIAAFNENEISLQSSPPWIKYESLIYWHENTESDPLFDMHEYNTITGKKLIIEDGQDTFFEICEELDSILGLETTHEKLSNFELLDYSDHVILLDFLHQQQASDAKDVFLQLLTTNKLFRLPKKDIGSFYCPSYSINRLSFLAGRFLFECWLEKENDNSCDFWHSQTFAEGLPHHFMSVFWGHTASKILNPHRKWDRYSNLILKASASSKDLFFHLCIKSLDSPENFQEILSKEAPIMQYKICHYLAHLSADFLFDEEDNSKQEVPQRFSEFLWGAPTYDHVQFILESCLKHDNFKRKPKRIF